MFKGGVTMENIFDVIDYRLAEIMTIIEIKLPLLNKDIPEFINQSAENEKLYNIYLEISNLRSF